MNTALSILMLALVAVVTVQLFRKSTEIRDDLAADEKKNTPHESANGDKKFPKKYECGVPTYGPKVRDIEWSDVKKHSWPWHVAMVVTNADMVKDKKDEDDPIYGATLIEVKGNNFQSDIVLTCANCITDFFERPDKKNHYEYIPFDMLKVISGVHENTATYPPGRVYGVVDVQAHHRFDKTVWNDHNHKADLALVKLDRPIKFSDEQRPICFPEKNAKTPEGEPCVNTAMFQKPALKQLKIKVLPDGQCKKDWNEDMMARMICGRADQEATAWLPQFEESGDEGSALSCLIGGRWSLYGTLTSIFPPRYGNKEVKLQRLWTRATFFRKWIIDTANNMTSL